MDGIGRSAKAWAQPHLVAACGELKPGVLDLDLLTGAPFLHVPDPEYTVTRRPTWFDFTGPRGEGQHWQALLPLMLWDTNLLRVDLVFTVARGRRFDRSPAAVLTTIRVYEGPLGGEEEVEVRDTHADP